MPSCKKTGEEQRWRKNNNNCYDEEVLISHQAEILNQLPSRAQELHITADWRRTGSLNPPPHDTASGNRSRKRPPILSDMEIHTIIVRGGLAKSPFIS
ncbi:hypothetical protein IAS59_005236 [Cryptococcus gattii]